MTNFTPRGGARAFRTRDADGSRNRMKGEAGLTGFPVLFREERGMLARLSRDP